MTNIDVTITTDTESEFTFTGNLPDPIVKAIMSIIVDNLNK